MDFNEKLYHLRRLFNDSERKLTEFNETIPFQFNEPSTIYSPKLINLMLEIGPQIEDITNQIVSELKLKCSGGVPNRIKEINKNGVLSSFEIFCYLPRKQRIEPFGIKSELWNDYNKIKHDLTKNQFNVKYIVIVNTMAALAALHRLSDVIVKIDKNRKYVLYKKYWKTFEKIPNMLWLSPLDYDPRSKIWRTSLFEIAQYFLYDHNLP